MNEYWAVEGSEDAIKSFINSYRDKGNSRDKVCELLSCVFGGTPWEFTYVVDEVW